MNTQTELMEFNRLLRKELQDEVDESTNIDEQLVLVKIMSAFVRAETNLMERLMLNSATRGEGDAVN